MLQSSETWAAIAGAPPLWFIHCVLPLAWLYQHSWLWYCMVNWVKQLLTLFAVCGHGWGGGVLPGWEGETRFGKAWRQLCCWRQCGSDLSDRDSRRDKDGELRLRLQLEQCYGIKITSAPLSLLAAHRPFVFRNTMLYAASNSASPLFII